MPAADRCGAVKDRMNRKGKGLKGLTGWGVGWGWGWRVACCEQMCGAQRQDECKRIKRVYLEGGGEWLVWTDVRRSET